MRNEPMHPERNHARGRAGARQRCDNLLPASEGLRLANSVRRCGARTRKGTPCRAPAVGGRRRCRMHGGAYGSGAQSGNRNALKSGCFSAEAVEMRRSIAALSRVASRIGQEI